MKKKFETDNQPLKPPSLSDKPEVYIEELEEKARHVLVQLDTEAPDGQVKFRLQADEDETSLPDYVENTYDNHLYLRNTLKPMTTPDTADRLSSSSVVYEYTLKRLLRLIRPFSYCQPDKGSIVVDEDITLDLTDDVVKEQPGDAEAEDNDDPALNLKPPKNDVTVEVKQEVAATPSI